MIRRDKYEIQPMESKTTFTERVANYYGNVRSLVLSSSMTGRRLNVQDEPMADEAALTAYRKDADDEGQHKPVSVDLNRARNRLSHNTQDYEIPNLILRRGQPFIIIINFERTFCIKSDVIVLKFVTGSRPLQSKGSVVSVCNTSDALPGDWKYEIIDVTDCSVTLFVTSSANAIVGRYEMFVDTIHLLPCESIESHRFKHPDDIYILFNPWSEDDDVYMENEADRTEYVLRETGRIWLGKVGKFCVRPWNFGQCEDVCLMAALALLDNSQLGDRARRSPVHIVRAICHMINNKEKDGGVLSGNWSGKYDDGIAPYAWNGSSAILEEFLKKRKAVKYGECWTFAAVATTMLRALGIPTRCVTCFQSTHNSDFSSPINLHWTTDNIPRKTMDDPIWENHVWGESWFERPDLPDNYGGWQAFDPTPFDCDKGVLTCGPASIKAIRMGELFYEYDTKLFLSQVYGEVINWLVDEGENMIPFQVEAGVIGRQISTKSVDTLSRLDVTDRYKLINNKEEETDMLTKAAHLCGRSMPRHIVNGTHQDVTFTFGDNGTKTGDVNAMLKMKNLSLSVRSVHVTMVAVAAHNTGVPAMEIKRCTETVQLDARQEMEVQLSLDCSEYIHKKDADSHLAVNTISLVKETGQRHATRNTLWIEKPHLELKCIGQVRIGQQFQVILKVVNTLNVPLTGGVLNVEGPGTSRVMGIKLQKSIGPGEDIRETVTLNAKRNGLQEIVANFYCREICNVSSTFDIDITTDNAT